MAMTKRTEQPEGNEPVNFESRSTGWFRSQSSSRPGTFRTVNLERLKLHSVTEVPAYAKALYDELRRIKRLRVAYYQDLRSGYSSVLGLRRNLIRLGIVALLATAISAAAQITGTKKFWFIDDVVTWGLGSALLAYALMTALSFYESATANSSAYFRSNAIIVAFRDLWEQYEFDQVGILAEWAAGADPVATKTELLATARALIAAMDTLSRTELDDWRGEVQTSLAQLAAIGKEGLASVKIELRAEYDQRLAKLEEAAKRAYVTLTINGDFVGEAELTIDGKQTIHTAQRQIALPEMTPGPHGIKASAKDKQGQLRSGAKWIDCKAGISEEELEVA